MVQAVVQTTVTGLQGHPVSATAPSAAGQALAWNGSAWAPSSAFLSTSGGTISGNLTVTGSATVSGTTTSGNVNATSGTIGGIQLANNVLSGVGNINGASVGSIGGVVMPGGAIIQASGNANSMGFTTFTNINSNIAAIGGVVFPGNQELTPSADAGGNCGVPGQAWFQVAAYNFPQSSDPRLKKDIAATPADPLASVLAIPVHVYRFTQQAETDPLHWGFLSTEVHTTMGTNFAGWMQGTDTNKTEALNLADMVAVLWAAVQELAQKANVT